MKKWILDRLYGLWYGFDRSYSTGLDCAPDGEPHCLNVTLGCNASQSLRFLADRTGKTVYGALRDAVTYRHAQINEELERAETH